MGLMDQAGEFLNSDQGKDMAGQGLNAGEDAVNNVTGDKFSEQVGQGRDFAEDQLGNLGGGGDNNNNQ